MIVGPGKREIVEGLKAPAESAGASFSPVKGLVPSVISRYAPASGLVPSLTASAFAQLKTCLFIGLYNRSAVPFALPGAMPRALRVPS